MGFIGLTLTKAGRRLIASAISEENPLNITHIQLGEGICEGTFAEMKGLAKKVMEIPVKSVKRDEGKVIINCDFNSTEAPKGFYFREVGIIGNGVLCYYDNSGDDAEYIDPETEGVIKQKRLRFTLTISSDVTVTVKISSELYAMAEEVEALKKSVSDGKANVAEAITDMGIKTESTEGSPATFGTLADHIREITPVLTLTGNTAKAKVGSNEVTEQIGNPMGGEITPGTSDALLIPAGSRIYTSSDYKMKSLGGNAEAAHVLTGKTFSSNAAGREKAGTMANQGAKTASLNCGGSYTIPAGYHNGSGKVTANSLASQTAPDSGKSAAGAAQILMGHQAYVNGSKVSGTMENQGAVTQNQSGAGGCGLAEAVYTIPAGYHNGSGKIKTFGAVGTYSGDPSTIKLVEVGPQANAFLWKRDAKLNYAMSLGKEYNVTSGTYQNYRIMNFRGGIKAELSNPGWKCTNRSAIVFVRQYILKNGVYAINTDQKATNAIYIQHGRSVRVQETASNIYLTFAWDAADGKIGIAVEGSAYIMHDLYIHIL